MARHRRLARARAHRRLEDPGPGSCALKLFSSSEQSLLMCRIVFPARGSRNRS